MDTAFGLVYLAGQRLHDQAGNSLQLALGPRGPDHSGGAGLSIRAIALAGGKKNRANPRAIRFAHSL